MAKSVSSAPPAERSVADGADLPLSDDQARALFGPISDDPDLLKIYANHCEDVARKCIRLAREKERIEKERRAFARQLAKEPFAKGLGEVASKIGVHAAAAQYGLPISTARVALIVFRRQERRIKTFQRNHKVMSYVQRGWSDDRIAKRLKIGKRTVSRIVSNVLRSADRCERLV